MGGTGLAARAGTPRAAAAAPPLGGALFYVAGGLWEGLLEPLVLRQPAAAPPDPLLLHGVDCSGSRFLRRAAARRALEFAAAAHAGQARAGRAWDGGGACQC